MKKTLVALAVGGAFAAPAFGEVTISGQINMSIEYLNVGSESDIFANRRAVAVPGSDPTPHDGVGNFGLGWTYTNITIASMEDLGGGLKLDFAAQIDFNTVDPSGLTNRNSHIGLVSDSWGGVWYGANENLYERYLYSQDPIDEAAGLGGNLQIMGTPGGANFGTCSRGDITTGVSPVTGGQQVESSCGHTWYRRDGQAIWYDSPSWNGFTFGVVFQTNFDKQSQPDADINPYMWQLGAKYVGTELPLQAWGAYGYRKDQFGLQGLINSYEAAAGAGANTQTVGATGSKDKALQFGLGYSFGAVYVFGVFEQLKYELDGVTAGFQEWKRNAYQIGMKWDLASGYLGASWMQAMDGSCNFVTPLGLGCEDTGAYSIGLGYYHTMSKNTQLFVVGSWLDNQDQGNYGTAGITNSALFNNVGATIWSAGIGIKHSF